MIFCPERLEAYTYALVADRKVTEEPPHTHTQCVKGYVSGQTIIIHFYHLTEIKLNLVYLTITSQIKPNLVSHM